jgi:Uma2 family endonuclease
MFTSDKKRSYTVEEYLALDEKSEIRHELIDGEMLAMAGTTLNHNELVDRIKDVLKLFFRPKGCNVYSESVKLEAGNGQYTYPDVILTCHPFDLRGSQHSIRQPQLLVEVLSKSTAAADRGIKWRKYRKMPSLLYYMLIDQYSTTIELFSRIEQTDEWVNSVYENLDDIVVLPRLNFEFTLKVVYDGLQLQSEEDVQEDA